MNARFVIVPLLQAEFSSFTSCPIITSALQSCNIQECKRFLEDLLRRQMIGIDEEIGVLSGWRRRWVSSAHH